MRAGMFLKRVRPGKGAWTIYTGVWTLSSMGANVDLQVRVSGKRFRAVGAGVWPLTSVGTLVDLKSETISKCLETLIALVRLLPTV